VAHFSKTAVACLRGFVCNVTFLCPQNEEMVTEGELRSNLDDSEKVRELQDKVADLKAEVYKACIFFVRCVPQYAQLLHSAANIFACDLAHCLSIDCTYMMQHSEGVVRRCNCNSGLWKGGDMSQTWKMSVSFSEHSKSTPVIKKCSWFSAISFGHWFLIRHDVFFQKNSECVNEYLKFTFAPSFFTRYQLNLFLKNIFNGVLQKNYFQRKGN
jgi:hypothetical protein